MSDNPSLTYQIRNSSRRRKKTKSLISHIVVQF